MGGGYDGIGSSQEFSSPFSGSENSDDTGLHSTARDEDDEEDEEDEEDDKDMGVSITSDTTTS